MPGLSSYSRRALQEAPAYSAPAYRRERREPSGAKTAAETFRTLMDNRPDGVIVIGTEMREADYGLLKLLTVPTVVLDNNILMENVDTVVMANRELMARQVRYLYGLGYREIGYFKFRQPANNCDERYEGYLSELSRLGLKTPEPILLEPTVDGAFEDITINE